MQVAQHFEKRKQSPRGQLQDGKRLVREVQIKLYYNKKKTEKQYFYFYLSSQNCSKRAFVDIVNLRQTIILLKLELLLKYMMRLQLIKTFPSIFCCVYDRDGQHECSPKARLQGLVAAQRGPDQERAGLQFNEVLVPTCV